MTAAPTTPLSSLTHQGRPAGVGHALRRAGQALGLQERQASQPGAGGGDATVGGVGAVLQEVPPHHPRRGAAATHSREVAAPRGLFEEG